MPGNNRGQVLTLIEILVVAVIVALAIYFIAGSYLGGSLKSKPGEPAAPLERAQGVDCANNLQQIRYAIHMFQTNDDKWPASLQDVERQGVTKAMEKCPVSGKPYSYDAAEGRVWCTTPGHEGY